MNARLIVSLLFGTIIILFYFKGPKIVLSQAPAAKNEPKTDPKIVLDWTGFFSNNMANLWKFFLRDCRHLENSCHFTTDKSLAEKAAAVIFHARQPGWKLTDMPKNRNSKQRYVMFLRETPPHTYLDFKKANGVFNWTMTHRCDSDVWWPGGKILKLNDSEKKNVSWEKIKEIGKGKTKLVAWWASNCNTHSKRELYVKELQKHIPVDVYGTCGNLTCPRDQNSCREKLKNDYFFYLSFENSMCTDFVTEKFYERIQDFVVPVVLRALDYRKVGPDGTMRAPEKSFIAADDFKSAAELAGFLKNLAADREKYLEYHKWRLHWRSTEYSTQSYSDPPLCKLCEMLHAQNVPERIRDDLYEWWFEGACETDYAKSIM